jgi:hypothetical protein
MNASALQIYLVSPRGQVHEVPQPSGVQDLVPAGMNDRGMIIAQAYSEATGYVSVGGV